MNNLEERKARIRATRAMREHQADRQQLHDMIAAPRHWGFVAAWGTLVFCVVCIVAVELIVLPMLPNIAGGLP